MEELRLGPVFVIALLLLHRLSLPHHAAASRCRISLPHLAAAPRCCISLPHLAAAFDLAACTALCRSSGCLMRSNCSTRSTRSLAMRISPSCCRQSRRRAAPEVRQRFVRGSSEVACGRVSASGRFLVPNPSHAPCPLVPNPSHAALSEALMPMWWRSLSLFGCCCRRREGTLRFMRQDAMCFRAPSPNS